MPGVSKLIYPPKSNSINDSGNMSLGITWPPLLKLKLNINSFTVQGIKLIT